MLTERDERDYLPPGDPASQSPQPSENEMAAGPTAQIDLFSAGHSAQPGEDAPEAYNFRLMGHRGLAQTWRQRAADNVAAIKVSQKIAAECRPATEAEQAKLIKWVGFGATEIANAIFRDKDESPFRPIAKSLKSAITADEWASLAQATQYAHYTPEYIVQKMWSGLRQIGFTGGDILEPGCGSGLFMALMPEGIMARSTMLGVERDPVTARIATQLYPEFDILQADFTKTALPSGFDLAIGNPPFSTLKVDAKDPAGKLGVSLHNYFIGRSIDQLRPGGVAAFVVSRYFLDAENRKTREFIADQADLLAAIRMPEASMRADAGTDVVVDILFFRKRLPDEPAGDTTWLEADRCGVTDGEGRLHNFNSYFEANPGMVLGKHAITSSRHGPTYTCERSGSPLDIALSGAIGTLPVGIYKPANDKRDDASRSDALLNAKKVQIGTAAEGARIKEGSYFVGAGDMLCQIIDGNSHAVQVKAGKGTTGMFAKHAKLIRDLIPIREAVRDVLRAQEADEPHLVHQARLNRVYDSFVAAHGPINTTTITERQDPTTGEVKESYRYPNLSVFSDDPDCWLVSSIEHYDTDSGEASKGAIFTQRVIAPPPSVTITSGADALSVVLNEKGRVDLPRIAELLGKTVPEAVEALGDTVFMDPATDAWEMADAYLSGKVRTKLNEAREAKKRDPSFAKNVKALEAVQPIDLLPSDIFARLGQPYIPASVVEDFVAQKMGIKTKIYHTPEIGVWSVPMAAFNGHAAATSDWGTDRRHAGHLLVDALTNSTPKIHDTIKNPDGSTSSRLNEAATQAVKDKLTAIHEAFAAWIWTDPVRSDMICKVYNENWNNLVARAFNGDHLVLPNASSVVTLRAHQKRAAWRMICAGSTYLAHAVGAGKTLTIIAAIMEQKRLGLVSKPMVVVPGHTLAQWSKEFLLLYPNANILVADEDNFSKEKRLRFVARAATGVWDAIIITHSAFKHLSVPAAFEEQMINGELASFDSMLKEIDSSDKNSIKTVEAAKEKLHKRLEKLESRKDDMLTISEMGVDVLYYDEAQAARKLTFQTNQGDLKGVDPNGSGTAWDLYVKSKFLAQKQPRRALSLASGTPITNTIGEMYTLLRFMNEAGLDERQIRYFDAWAAAFGDTKTELELQPNGAYKPVTRFAEFINIPELFDMFAQVADIVLFEDLKNFVQLPRILKGERQIKTAPGSKEFKEYQKLLDVRMNIIKERRGKPEKGDDIILSVIGDGRHAAIDVRLVSPLLDMHRPMVREKSTHLDIDLLRRCAANDNLNKLNMMIDSVHSIWKETRDWQYRNPSSGDFYPIPGAAQMIFCDLGTEAAAAKRGFSAYTWIVQCLVELGIPRSQIAIMQHFKRLAAKQRLFADVNAGRVSILIGSSQTMGTGVNAQQRLVALHHLDEPWLPSDIEQREGRLIRQGNQNEEVRIFGWATLGSMDATMWQFVERKARFINAVLRGDRSIRRLEDLEAGTSQAEQFAMAKAMASGDDRLYRKAGLEMDIGRLQRQRNAWHDNQSTVRRNVRWAKEDIAKLTDTVGHITRDLDIRVLPDPDVFSAIVEGVTFTDTGTQVYTVQTADEAKANPFMTARKRAAKAIEQAISNTLFDSKDRDWIIGEYCGFRLGAEGWMHHWTNTGGREEKAFILKIRVLRNGQKDEVYSQDIKLGDSLFARVEKCVTGFEDQLAEATYKIAEMESVIRDYEPRINADGFDRQPVLDEKLALLKALNEDLAKSDGNAAKAAPEAANDEEDETEAA